MAYSHLSRLFTAILCLAACSAIAQQYTIKTIVFNGTVPYSQSALEAASGLKPGDTITKADLQAAAQRLVDTGAFADLQSSLEGPYKAISVLFAVKPIEPGRLLTAGFENFIWYQPEELAAELQKRVPLFSGTVPEGGNEQDAQRYVSKVSGPLLDRIDIHIEVPAVQYKELRGGSAAEGSAEIRDRVLKARAQQRERFREAGDRTRGTAKGASRQVYANAQMGTQQIRMHCELSSDAERLLERAMQQQGLSARAHDRILKVARTIADLEASPDIVVKHIAEAIQYRTLDRSYWS